jgi:hypothetical protein
MLMFVQQVYSPSEFTQVPGSTLQAKYDAAIAQGRRGADDSFWVAYQFPVRPGIRIMTWGDSSSNMTITSTTSSDGIEWVPDATDIQRIGIFMLTRKSDGVAQKSRIINLNQNFANSEESLSLLTKLATSNPQVASSFVSHMSLHGGATVGDHLLELAKSTTIAPELRRSAISALGRELGRQAGDELNKLVTDPNTDIQRQAVAAISRRSDDEAIPSLIRIAREHQNASVRSYAIQMLAQKKDPRVLDFFEQVLKKNR